MLAAMKMAPSAVALKMAATCTKCCYEMEAHVVAMKMEATCMLQ